MTSPPTRDMPIRDTEAHLLIRFLCEFLGPANVLKRIKRVNRTLASEKGVYRQYWVLPNAEFWLGLVEAMQVIKQRGTLAGSLTPRMYAPLEFAAKLSLFKPLMPPQRLNDLRGRVINSDYLFPVLLEIDTAAHLWQLGYEIEWPPPPKEPNIRVSEFLANRKGKSLEVECKAQRADAGRRIVRPIFYRIVDAAFELLASLRLHGKVDISTPGRIPTADSWRRELIETISLAAVANPNATLTLTDGSEVRLELLSHELVISAQDMEAQVSAWRSPISHVAITAEDGPTAPKNPIILRVQSKTPDEVLSSYFEDLRDANHQLSSTTAGLIVCFIPEVHSFEGLERESAIHNMTAAFFDRHAETSVYAVSYVTDWIEGRNGSEVTRRAPALSFRNHKYDTKFGDAFELLS